MRAFVLVVLLAGCGGGGPAPKPSASPADAALDAFARGDLDAADALLRENRDLDSIQLRARGLLLRNRSREAVELLTPLLREKPKKYEDMERQQRLLPDLVNAYVRQDDFLNASRVLAQLGESIQSRKYEILARTVAYASELPGDEVYVDFVGTDPLPVVAGTVNGRRALFVIDTLLDEITLDRDFARRAQVEAVGNFPEGAAKEIGLGRALIRNVPLHLGEAATVGTLKPDGAIGLSFLMHFDFTLDYRRGRLILRRAGGSLQGQPAYWAGDRYLLTSASANGQKTFAALGTSLKGVALASSEMILGSLGGAVTEFSAGGIRLVKPSMDVNAFPAGLDGSFGIAVGFVLGHQALRNRVVRVEPRSMRIAID